MTDNRTQKLMAVLLIISSIALAFTQAITLQDIANGVLMYIAQAFLLAGSLFGLDYYTKKMFDYIRKNQDSKTNTTATP